jgi:hypothetical protein
MRAKALFRALRPALAFEFSRFVSLQLKGLEKHEPATAICCAKQAGDVTRCAGMRFELAA